MTAAPLDVEQEVRRGSYCFEDELARRKLHAFCHRMYDAYEDAAHALLIIDALQRCVLQPDGRLIITSPPRHGKSIHVSEMMPAWYIGKFPDHTILSAAHSQRFANTFSRRVRAKINDPRYPFDVRISDERSAVEAWEIEGHLGAYNAFGVGSSPIGLGGNLLLMDDLIKNAKDANSELVRNAVWEWYVSTFRTRLQPGGSIVLTATRWHEDDLTGRLLLDMQAGGEPWEHLHLPAIAMPDVVPDPLGRSEGEALWPGEDDEWWPVERLDALRKLDEYVFNAQYQGRPAQPKGAILHDDGWSFYTVSPQTVVGIATRILIMVDSASKLAEQNDFTVFAVWADVDAGNPARLPAGYYLVDLVQRKVEMDDLLDLGERMWERYTTLRRGRVRMIVEDKSSGIALIQMLRQRKVPVEAYNPGEPDKVTRVRSISVYVNHGLCYLPAMLGAVNTKAFRDEHKSFPFGKHDDMVDTTAMLLYYCEIAPPQADSRGTTLFGAARDGRHRRVGK